MNMKVKFKVVIDSSYRRVNDCTVGETMENNLNFDRYGVFV